MQRVTAQRKGQRAIHDLAICQARSGATLPEQTCRIYYGFTHDYMNSDNEARTHETQVFSTYKCPLGFLNKSPRYEDA